MLGDQKINHTRRRVLGVSLFFVTSHFLSVFAPLHAHSTIDSVPSLRQLANGAALVFFGNVENIVYRNSEPTDEEPLGIPHTFVTYSVNEVLLGELPSKKIVLRFSGGADGAGGVYMESTTPTFARGQSDILFVEPGEQDNCPLVGCADGRFRVSDNNVFNAWGIPVVAASEEIVVGGKPRLDLLKMDLPRPDFDQLIARPEVKKLIAETFSDVSIEELRKRYLQEAPAEQFISYVSSKTGTVEEGESPGPITLFGAAITLESFLREVELNFRGIEAKGTYSIVSSEESIRVEPPAPLAIKLSAADKNNNESLSGELKSLLEGED